MGRIQGRRVEALFPAEGPVHVLLMGEAPGPLGADQSGLPFWGDRAGQLVYRALERAGMAEVPAAAWEDWDGGRFQAMGLQPTLRGAVLGNAFPCCPTDDGQKFRAPKDRELRDPANLARLGADLAQAAARCPGRLRIIGLGRRAAWVLDQLVDAPPHDLVVLPHPSAQGLLQAAPEKGRGLQLRNLQDAWMENLASILSQDSHGS
ncbi:MAG TPA: uracil-DNA glycosylase family protein [Holophagaceae bacterium]|nr:uracil-DNA glycosylase family protein [Holophagaceae bacterium]